MAPRPTPRPTRPAPPAPKPLRPQPSTVVVLGYAKDRMVSEIIFRDGDKPFDQDGPPPPFPLHLISYAPA